MNMQMKPREDACGVFPLHQAEQKARVISIIQLGKYSSLHVGTPAHLELFEGPELMLLCAVVLRKPLK